MIYTYVDIFRLTCVCVFRQYLFTAAFPGMISASAAAYFALWLASCWKLTLLSLYYTYIHIYIYDIYMCACICTCCLSELSARFLCTCAECLICLECAINIFSCISRIQRRFISVAFVSCNFMNLCFRTRSKSTVNYRDLCKIGKCQRIFVCAAKILQLRNCIL